MSKIATVRLGWTRSASPDVAKVVVNYAVDGVTTSVETGPDAEELVIDVAANSSLRFSLTVTDADGQSSTSEVCARTFGDLVAPQPPTGLFADILSVRDVPDPTLGPVA